MREAHAEAFTLELSHQYCLGQRLNLPEIKVVIKLNGQGLPKIKQTSAYQSMAYCPPRHFHIRENAVINAL